MKRKTVGDVRYFACKMCGTRISEPIESWRKKPQADKNLCEACREARSTAAETARERAYIYGHRRF